MRSIVGIISLLCALLGMARSTALHEVPDNNRHRWLHDDAGVMQVNHESFLLNKLRHIYDSCGLEIYVIVDEGEGIDTDSACEAFAEILMKEWSLTADNDEVILIYTTTRASKASVAVSPELRTK